MNKVIASASPAINAEGLDIWLLQVPELLVGFLIVVGTTGLAVLVSMAMWKSPRVAGKSPHSDAGDWLTGFGGSLLVVGVAHSVGLAGGHHDGGVV